MWYIFLISYVKRTQTQTLDLNVLSHMNSSPCIVRVHRRGLLSIWGRLITYNYENKELLHDVWGPRELPCLQLWSFAVRKTWIQVSALPLISMLFW